tara:strand:- start:751 stop:1122 length:372 start_codon:yes stop_codon:yes gene_type:complete
MKSTLNTVCIVLLAILLLDADWNFKLPTITTPDTVAVIYESSDTIPPPYVTGALGNLQADGLQTRIFDKDVVTGAGQVPEYLKNAIDEATKNGLPALVVLSKGNVIKVQDLPKTESEIIEAVK